MIRHAIGYQVAGHHLGTAAELAELLKIGAEPVQDGAAYAVVITDGIEPLPNDVDALIVYSAQECALDRELGISVVPSPLPVTITAGYLQQPSLQVLTPCSYLRTRHEPFLGTKDTAVAVHLPGVREGRTVVRFGYSLLDEAARLLSLGQPEPDAMTPSLDCHLEILRYEICRRQILIEIPPRPAEYPLIVTLSHDIDRTSLRELGLSERWLSFMRQSMLWTLLSFVERNLDLGSMLDAWMLALRSPLILAGLLPDPWTRIHRYVPIERHYGGRSTYFFIPFPERAGVDLRRQPNHRRRGARYALERKRPIVRRLKAEGCEIGVHGIDAWVDGNAARTEREVVASVTGEPPAGVRMHYLYQTAATFKHLDAAGFAYDSTFGYPRGIGFRAGTTQPFRPAETHRLLELGVNLEDGCLLERRSGNSSPEQARKRVDTLLDWCARYGGTLNVSWHDASLEPPHSWGHIYRYILRRANGLHAWMITLAQAARWFEERRHIRLSTVLRPDGTLAVNVALAPVWPADLPPPMLRVHIPEQPEQGAGGHRLAVDLPLRSGSFLVSVDRDNGTVRVE